MKQKNMVREHLRHAVLGGAVLGLLACPAPNDGGGESASDPTAAPAEEASPFRPATDTIEATPEAIEEAFIQLARNKRAIAETWADRDFETFEAGVYREPDTGHYIVNGDVPITDVKHLQEFFEQNVAQGSPDIQGLVVNTAGGVDTVWNDSEKRSLTYCVSTGFGARHDQVVTAMSAAGGAWEGAADIDFIHAPTQDGACTAANNQVVFDVRPVTGASYLARAFFPDDARSNRNVLINSSSFTLSPSGNLSLTGILRHELGHTLGFRHEHTRPEAGQCFEDDNWRPLTSYDAFSTMHYPQCNGGGDWKLNLTAADQSGAACLYGPASGFTIDTNVCIPPTPIAPTGCGPITVTESGSVAQGVNDAYGPYSVAQGTNFTVQMAGTGDPDLYVRFRQPPGIGIGQYDCRPFLTGAAESCDLPVPFGATTAHVMVRGFTNGTYNLTIEHTPTP